MNKNPNPISDFKDEIAEELESLGKMAKKQLTTKAQQTSQAGQAQQTDEKKDPTTGKPVPSKKMLTQLNQQVAQLSQMRLKKVREELEKQRLKTKQTLQTGQTSQTGPEVKPEEKKPDDIVAKTLKGSKSTGEFKGLIGG